MATDSFLAFDLGASSGRAILGTLEEGRISIRELTRFPNEMVELHGRLHWDIVQLYQEVKKGLRACAEEGRGDLRSVAVDTWGVDFGLLAADGSLLGLPYAYRDPRNQGTPEEFFQRVPRRRVYELTGIQVMPLNSLYQLYVLARDQSPLLSIADALLFTPDLLSYFLAGVKKTEFTIATTSQLYNPVRRGWEPELFAALGVPQGIMQEIVPPGTVLGPLRSPVARETGLPEMPVIATASHDTGSAVAAAPAEGMEWAYISSGTWSLVGFESDRPIISDQALDLNITNEGGVEGTFRLLKNVSGLWLVQECRRAWARDQLHSYEELAHMASTAAPSKALLDPDHPDFLSPTDMPEAIVRYCRRTNQPVPEGPADFVRCILESLALKYRLVLDQLRQVSPRPLKALHIIGGGCRNETLCQFSADATSLPVLAGPSEATAVGNLLVQALALGQVGSLAEVRKIVRRSFPLRRYEPQQTAAWEAAYERFRSLVAVQGS